MSFFTRELKTVATKRLLRTYAQFPWRRAEEWRIWRLYHEPQNNRDANMRAARALGTHTHEQWESLVELYAWKCFYCGVGLTFETLTQDHVLAVSKGGSDAIDNLVPACRPCNSSKGAQ